MTMAHIPSNYWIPRLRQLVRKVIKSCYVCRRFQAKAALVLRTTAARNASTRENRRESPLSSSWSRLRWTSEVSEKHENGREAYVVLYACSLTRAIYIELLSSHTQEFLQSLKRFIARRGRAEKINSDNDKTFLAAAKWLRTVQRDEKLQNFLARSEIHWQFNL